MDTPLAAAGILGRNHTLAGGFLAKRLSLIHGERGVGTTTLGLTLVLEGVRVSEARPGRPRWLLEAFVEAAR